MTERWKGNLMSFIGGGGSNILISPGQTQNWVWTWGGAGWQGNTLLEPQPLSPQATLTYQAGSVTLNANGTYSFAWSVTNNGPFATLFNIQTSSNCAPQEASRRSTLFTMQQDGSFHSST